MIRHLAQQSVQTPHLLVTDCMRFWHLCGTVRRGLLSGFDLWLANSSLLPKESVLIHLLYDFEKP